jgi:hypothetical protein
MPVDPVHPSIEVFHVIFYRKIIHKFQKFIGALYFYKSTPNFSKIIFSPLKICIEVPVQVFIITIRPLP